MPCYNASATLDETMQSLLAQRFEDFEVVAVDDGSTDDTRRSLRRWVGEDARVRVLELEHGGIIEALNAGLTACRGELVARMDADDVADPQRLEKQAAYLDAHPEVGLVGCLVEGFPAEELRDGFRIYIDWLNSLVDDPGIRRELFVESPFAHPSAMYRKALVEGLGGYQEHGWAEDYDLWLRMAEFGVGFAKVPEVLLRWRDHPERLTRRDSRYSLENFLRAKAHYLLRGPLAGRDALLIWGAGMMGRRLSKHLQRGGAPLQAFVEVDAKKIGRTRRGRPILAAEELPEWWERFANPALLVAVGARGARPLIREHLADLSLVEGRDWWAAA